jgi:hypothetical protein
VLHALIVFAQEAAHEEETSKTAYYVAGCALAAFAVIISVIGIRGHETFPSSKGGRGVVMLIATVLVAATMASAILTG